jgi:hypothetical protein
MMASLALLSALSVVPAQDGQLRITNERATYGILGAPRTSAKYLPGDVYWITFDIDNLKVDKNGKVSYRMSVQLLDKNDKPQFKSDPQDLEMISALGGSRIPSFALADLGTSTPPGEYTIKVQIEDRATKNKVEMVKKFEVAEKDFGIVRLTTSYDMEGQLLAPAFAVPGQSIWVNFALAGFKRDEKTKQPNISLDWRILDESGKPTLEKPIPGEITEGVKEGLSLVPTQFLLMLNRSGKYTIEISATDKNSKKTSTLKYPITVLETK